jgi:hypothetical protein
MKLAKYIGQQVLDIVKLSLTEPVIYSYQVNHFKLTHRIGDDEHLDFFRRTWPGIYVC